MVVALIVASSAISLANPFLVREVIDRAIPEQNVHAALWAVVAMLAITVATAVFGVVQTWISTTVGQRIMHNCWDAGVHTTAAPVARLLHPHPRR
ncbi:hypothetical protein GTA09_29530 [Rhodococcus hoagii]|nr:hypothetical protein [Prescottella equi]